jgi:hypothetical protein
MLELKQNQYTLKNIVENTKYLKNKKKKLVEITTIDLLGYFLPVCWG